MFVPPINLGGWKPSPATMSEWIYQIWKYLQENPIASQEQIKEYVQQVIGSDIGELLPEVLPEELDKYFEENPIDFPVDSVNGKLGTVLLELADIVQSDSMLPVVSLANDEADQETLIDSFEAGARICVIDEESVSVMLPTYAQDGSVSAITLLPMSTGGGEGGGDFSPITLSIGSSGNKTLNAGGTVAFTLSEIGAAPASISTTISGIQEDITDLQETTRPMYKSGDTMTINSAFRVFGSINNTTKAGFTLILPIVIDDNVTTFSIENAGTVVLRSSRTASRLVESAVENGTSCYITGTVGVASVGIMSFIITFPAISSLDTSFIATLTFPADTPTYIHFN